MSDKMSEVEAAKKAVLAKWPNATVMPSMTGEKSIWTTNDLETAKPLNISVVPERAQMAFFLTEDCAWLDAASKIPAPLTGCGCWGGIVCDKCKLAPLTEDMPKCKVCTHALHEGACGSATDCLCVQYPSLRGVKVPASPVGELEGAFEAPKRWTVNIGRVGEIPKGTYVTWSDYENLLAAISSKPAPDGIPERPIEIRCDEGQHVYCSAAGTTRYAKNVTAIISDKEDEIHTLKRRLEIE